MRPSAHGTWLGRNAVCLYLYMCIIIPSSFQALPGWTIVTCSHLNAWSSSSSSTKTVTKWRNSEAQSQKKGSVTGLVFCLMRNSCFTWHFPFYFMNYPKGSSVNFFPLSAAAEVRSESKILIMHVPACRSPKAVVLDDKRKAILSVRLICIQMTVRDTRCSAISIGK